MSYERTFWENGKTPINADNLNKLEEGVSANAEALFAVNENMSALTEEVGTKAEQTDLEALGTDLENVENNVGTLENRVSALELSGGGGGGELPTGILTVSDIKPNLEGNETDKMPSVSAVKTAIEVAKEEVLENIPSGGDEATVRYVSNEADENFGWVQYLDANGTWVNWEQAVMTNYPLYTSDANEGKFEAYAGKMSGSSGNTTKAPTVSFGTTMDVSFSTPNYGDNFVGCAISELVDLSKFSKLRFQHITTKNIHANSQGAVKVYITTTKGSTMTAVTSRELNGSGDIEIDISSVNGKCHIAVEVFINCSGMQTDTVMTKISNMYME